MTSDARPFGIVRMKTPTNVSARHLTTCAPGGQDVQDRPTVAVNRLRSLDAIFVYELYLPVFATRGCPSLRRPNVKIKKVGRHRVTEQDRNLLKNDFHLDVAWDRLLRQPLVDGEEVESASVQSASQLSRLPDSIRRPGLSNWACAWLRPIPRFSYQLGGDLALNSRQPSALGRVRL
jgi:hypothetical protein